MPRPLPSALLVGSLAMIVPTAGPSCWATVTAEPVLACLAGLSLTSRVAVGELLRAKTMVPTAPMARPTASMPALSRTTGRRWWEEASGLRGAAEGGQGQAGGGAPQPWATGAAGGGAGTSAGGGGGMPA